MIIQEINDENPLKLSFESFKNMNIVGKFFTIEVLQIKENNKCIK